MRSGKLSAIVEWLARLLPSVDSVTFHYGAFGRRSFTVKKLECSRQAICLNTLAWNNGIGRRTYFVGSRTVVMINRDSWGRSYSVVRGEILGFTEDELLRKHSARMFSLIKNES